MAGKLTFKDAHYFTCINPHRAAAKQRWYCNLCAGDEPASYRYMSKSQTIAHEKHSQEHSHNLSNIADSCQWWSTPTDPSAWDPEPPKTASSLAELRAQSSWGYETCSSYLIPYWRDALIAAERGEDLKLEAFMERQHRAGASGWEPWTRPDNTSESASDDWGGGVSSWGKPFVKCAEDWRADPQEGESASQLEEEDFVEAMASRFHAGPEKKQAMHYFYQMSTVEKVQAIQEMARDIPRPR